MKLARYRFDDPDRSQKRAIEICEQHFGGFCKGNLGYVFRLGDFNYGNRADLGRDLLVIELQAFPIIKLTPHGFWWFDTRKHKRVLQLKHNRTRVFKADNLQGLVDDYKRRKLAQHAIHLQGALRAQALLNRISMRERDDRKAQQDYARQLYDDDFI